MNQSHRYRAAIIGLGFVGGGDQVSGDRIGQQVIHLDGHHRSAWMNNDRIDLIAGCDLDEGRRNRFSAATGAKVFSNWEAMLDDILPDVVSIAVYTPAHAELTIACAERGVRVVYCEKPIATSLAEAEQMIAACESKGTLLVINHNRRFNPNYRRLRDRIAAGDLGELTSVYLRWSTGRLGCVGTHLIDAARMLTGREVVSLSALLDRSVKRDCRGPEFHDPGGWGLFRMEGELMALVNAGNHAVGPAQIVIEGTRGSAVAGGDAVEWKPLDGPAEVWPSRRSESTSMDRAVSEIVAWLDAPGDFSTPAVESLVTLEIIVGMHASDAHGGGWKDLPLTGVDRDLRVDSG